MSNAEYIYCNLYNKNNPSSPTVGCGLSQRLLILARFRLTFLFGFPRYFASLSVSLSLCLSLSVSLCLSLSLSRSPFFFLSISSTSPSIHLSTNLHSSPNPVHPVHRPPSTHSPVPPADPVISVPVFRLSFSSGPCFKLRHRGVPLMAWLRRPFPFSFSVLFLSLLLFLVPCARCSSVRPSNNSAQLPWSDLRFRLLSSDIRLPSNASLVPLTETLVHLNRGRLVVSSPVYRNSRLKLTAADYQSQWDPGER
jgi:hypothetical protein